MNFKHLLSLVAIAGLSISCQPEKAAESNSVQPPHEVKLNELPLDQALAKKYSRLQLKCQRKATFPAGNGVSSIETTESQVTWDILRDFSKRRTIVFAENIYGKIRYDFKLDFELSLFSGEYFETGVPHPRSAKFLNSAYLEARSIGKIYTFDASGTSLSYGTNTSSVDFNEKLLRDIESMEIVGGPNKEAYSLSLSCILEADVNPPYQSDSHINL